MLSFLLRKKEVKVSIMWIIQPFRRNCAKVLKKNPNYIAGYCQRAFRSENLINNNLKANNYKLKSTALNWDLSFYIQQIKIRLCIFFF